MLANNGQVESISLTLTCTPWDQGWIYEPHFSHLKNLDDYYLLEMLLGRKSLEYMSQSIKYHCCYYCQYYYYVGNVGSDQKDQSLSNSFNWIVGAYCRDGFNSDISHILLGLKMSSDTNMRRILVTTELVSMESAKSRGDWGIWTWISHIPWPAKGMMTVIPTSQRVTEKKC